MMPRGASVLCLLGILASGWLLSTSPLPAQKQADSRTAEDTEADAVRLQLSRLQRYSVRVSYNLRTYSGGSYEGLLHREVRGRVSPAEDGAAERGAPSLNASYFVLQETYRQKRNAAKEVQTRYRTRLEPQGDGSVSVEEDAPLPRRRNFPASPPEAVRRGDTWSAPAELVLDPLWSGNLHYVRIEPEYRFNGREQYKGTAVYRVTARYGFRYRPETQHDTAGDEHSEAARLVKSTGSHTSVILIEVESGQPVLIRDRIEERHRFAERPGQRFEGFALTWYTEPPPFDATRVARSIEERLAEDSVADVQVSSTEEGVRIRLDGVHFVADEATILPEERPRLDALAATLRDYPQRDFLVVGHTADVGKPAGQKRLSVERAKTVVRELSRRGLPRDRFLYEGRGGTDPIADNETAAGRAKNRRVELFVLE